MGREVDWNEVWQRAPLAKLGRNTMQAAPWEPPLKHLQGELRRATDWTGAILQRLKKNPPARITPLSDTTSPQKPTPSTNTPPPHTPSLKAKTPITAETPSKGLSVVAPQGLTRLAGRPSWAAGLEGWQDEEAKIDVTVPKGCLCELQCAFKVGLPPEQVFGILTDPSNNRVFKNIKEVTYRKTLEDDGVRRSRVEVEQSAIWKFLCFSGTFSVCVEVEQDKVDHWINFKLARSGGFMKEFAGSWKIEPIEFAPRPSPTSTPDTGSAIALAPPYPGAAKGIASYVVLKQVVQPAMIPPPPLDRYVRGISVKTTQDMLRDLQKEAARIRHGRPVVSVEEAREQGREERRAEVAKDVTNKKAAPSTKRKSRLYSGEERKEHAPLVHTLSKRSSRERLR